MRRSFNILLLELKCHLNQEEARFCWKTMTIDWQDIHHLGMINKAKPSEPLTPSLQLTANLSTGLNFKPTALKHRLLKVDSWRPHRNMIAAGQTFPRYVQLPPLHRRSELFSLFPKMSLIFKPLAT